MVNVAQCPVSWGVELPDDPTNPPWETYLDEAAAAGYGGVELGPVGYLPTDSEALAQLSKRGLSLSAGYVMEPLSDPSKLGPCVATTRAAARILSEQGANVLILIDDENPVREPVAGRPGDAPRLDDEDFDRLVQTAREVAAISMGEYGIPVGFHPHAGTYVEYADEIEKFFDATKNDDVGLCLDTGHSMYAGVDPVELVRTYGGRLRYLHLKDLDFTVLDRARNSRASFNQAVSEGVFCRVGEGVVDWDGLRSALEDVGFQGWVSIEQDRTPGSLPIDSAIPLKDARHGLEFLVARGLATPE